MPRKDEGHPPERPRRRHDQPLTNVPRLTERAPRLVIDLGLEEAPVVRLIADTYEDELRLRSWLRRAASIVRLPITIDEALDALDRGDARRAA